MAANSIRAFNRLLANPQRWPALTTPQLGDLLKFACIGYGTTVDPARLAIVGKLLAHYAETASVDTRLQLVLELASMLDGFARERETAPVGVLVPFVLDDPSFDVVSTASLQLAQLMPLADGDSLTGPRMLVEMAEEMREPHRQAAILAGLTVLGDEEVFDLIERSWHRLCEAAQLDLIACMGRQPATTAAIEFLVTRLECWIAEEREGPIGHVVPTLIRLAQRAAGSPDRRRAADTGIFEIERTFPSWSVPADVDPADIRRTYSVEEFGRAIAPRLTRLAELERYPRLLPMALRAWGADDGPLVRKLREAARKHLARRGGAQLAARPVRIQPVPDWDRHDCFLEWGILDPLDPTKVQWCLVPLDRRTRALVYTVHNPFEPVSLLLGVLEEGDGHTLRRMLLDLADRFELGDHAPLRGLPHWVKTSPVDRVQIADDDGAMIFQRLHRAALSRGVADDADVAEQVQSLRLLRENPLAEANEQSTGVMKKRRSRPFPDPAADDYLLWYRAASSSEHVRALTSRFMPCWNSALRLQLP